MYINDTNILFYMLASIIGLVVGQLVDWANERLLENKKIFSTDIFRKYKIDFKPNYVLMILVAVIYTGLVYKFGVQKNFVSNLNLIKYVILTPLLLSVLVIDYKKQIIPNRLVLTMVEIGLVISFLYGISNVVITIDMLFGMLAGALIFLIISLIGKLIYNKDAMGFGDIKLMGAVGLYFGFTNIISIAVMAFLIGAISAVLLVLIKKKKATEDVAFAPFIVISAFINIFVPFEIIITILKTVFTLGMYKR